MPELPEVETVRRGLVPILEGAVLKDVTVRRFDLRRSVPYDFAQRLTGRRIVRLNRRAKYILGEVETGETMLIHLGMSGRMAIHRAGTAMDAPGKHDHIVLETRDGDRIVFNDPRRFGMVDLFPAGETANHPLLRDLGPEPLSNGFSAAGLSEALDGRRTPIKAALLDQKTVAGLGNIYVCEALWRAHISPRRSAATVSGRRAERLVPAIRTVLEEAIAAGGSSLKDYRQANGELGYFQHNFRVYGREDEACLTENCDGIVRRIVQSGRSSFYCPRCQG